jgi:hypothetical protein
MKIHLYYIYILTKNESNPGRGWIMVHCKSLLPDSITSAVRRGDFYATMGVIISMTKIEDDVWKIKVDEGQTKIEIERSNTVPRIDQTGTAGFTIDYIGEKGKTLSSVSGKMSSFKIPRDEKYVRAGITFCTKTSERYEKRFAWLQPYIIDKTYFGLVKLISNSSDTPPLNSKSPKERFFGPSHCEHY